MSLPILWILPNSVADWYVLFLSSLNSSSKVPFPSKSPSKPVNEPLYWANCFVVPMRMKLTKWRPFGIPANLTWKLYAAKYTIFHIALRVHWFWSLGIFHHRFIYINHSFKK